MEQKTSGISTSTSIIASILIVILLAGNIYFSTQYIAALKSTPVQTDNTAQNIKIAHFLGEFITVVLTPNSPVSVDSRVMLEDDVRQLNDPVILAQWESFVNSTSTADSQQNAIKLMSMLAAKMV